MQNETFKVNPETPELVSFIAGAQKIINEYYALHFPGSTAVIAPTLESSVGLRYVRIVKVERHEGVKTAESAHSFIDRKNGDVLKPASWRSPAKRARGNIFDAHNGLETVNHHGPAYLR